MNSPSCLLVAALISCHCHAEDKYVDIWLRSFIGNAHPQLPNYVKKTSSGLYVIEAPYIPVPNFIDIGRLTGTCFTTDQRSNFSPSLDESARVGIYLRIYIEGREVKVGKIGEKPNIVIGSTRNVDCKTGRELVPPLKANEADVTITDVRTSEFLRSFSVRSAAGDPFYKFLGRRISPSLSFEIIFSYKVKTRQLEIKGSIEDFPWFEAYYQKKGGRVVKIINSGPQGTATALSLIEFGTGLHTRNFSEEIDLLDF